MEGSERERGSEISVWIEVWLVSKMKKKTNRECVLGKCGGHYFVFPLGEESVG